MRTYIFNFDQNLIVKLGLNIEQTTLLDYLLKFFNFGKAKSIYIDKKKYCWITYNKILEDLPLLNYTKKKLRCSFMKMEQLGIIKRYVENRHKLYLYIDEQLLFYGRDNEKNSDESKILPSSSAMSTIEGIEEYPKGSPIVNYYNNNNINIIYSGEKNIEINKSDYINLLTEKLKSVFSKIIYSIWFEETKVTSITQNEIVLEVYSAKVIKNNYKQEFEECIINILSK